MIFVSLGTQDKPFTRLLDKIEELISRGVIKDKVIVQAGLTHYTSKQMTILDIIPIDKFDQYIKDCDLLITHGGVGSIIKGIKNNKKVIAVARLKKYHEHTNDHQLQIVDNFYQNGYILKSNIDDLDNVLNQKFIPKKYESHTTEIMKVIKDFIGMEK